MRGFAKTLAALATAGCLLSSACGGGEKAPAPVDPAGKTPTGSSGQPGNGGASTRDAGSSSAGSTESGPAQQPAIARSTRSSLQWKRHAAFEADLSQALELTPDELCNEFGKDPCIRKVHMSPLGGHDPFTTGLLESSAEPLVTTSTVVERVVLSACIARREKDRALGPRGVVFGGLDLSAPAPAPSDSAVRALIGGLYQRFLARDAEAAEVDVLAALTRDESGGSVKAEDFAAAVCMAVGSSSEFLFF